VIVNVRNGSPHLDLGHIEVCPASSGRIDFQGSSLRPHLPAMILPAKGHWSWILPLVALGCQSDCDGRDDAEAGESTSDVAATDADGPSDEDEDTDGPADGESGTEESTETGVDGPVPPFEAVPPEAALRKIKNLLTGIAPTEAEVDAIGTTDDLPGTLRDLIDDWIEREHPDAFREKMIGFFQNAFQQTGFNAREDFKPQLLQNGGFDFGPLGFFGDDAFPELVHNLEESFARTAWEFVETGQPFTNVLTTQRFMMTTALKSLYVQIEMPNDQPFSSGGQSPDVLVWRVDLSGTPIPLEQTLDPASPNFMTFSDEPTINAVGFQLEPTCQGEDRVIEFTGYAQLFQRLLGFTQRFPFAAAEPECWEHVSLPYFTDEDLSDWQMVTIRPLGPAEEHIQPSDLPALRRTTELGLELPRVGYYTTPAYLALWNTNDSNQHRVTANQTLLVALGRSFSGAEIIFPTLEFGLDAEHAVEGSSCYGCHRSLDPLAQFWEGQYDFDDRNDFPTFVFGGTPNPRPTETGGALAFGNVNQAGASITDLGVLLAAVIDDAGSPTVNRFALEMTQKLCYWADSAPCAESDPEFRRIGAAFEASDFDFKVLIRELFASPLVTGASYSATFETRAALISVARREQLCTALSNRLGRTDLCALRVAFPFQTGFASPNNEDPLAAERATFRIAGSVAADAFSRGSEVPVTPADPNLFYRAASELLCEDIAAKVVDGSDPIYVSQDSAGAIADMVVRVMGYTTSEPQYAEAVRILTDNLDASTASGASGTDALRSTFALACQSPTSLGVGI